MLFNSLLFLFFFLIITSGYYLLPHRFRWVWLLAGSCYFYMYFKPVYVLIIFFTIGIDYIAGLLIERSTGRQRKLWLLLSLVANIGILAFYKYFNFVAENVNLLTGLWHGPPIPLLDIILPIGLSFHTFQAMSYTIEVYRGNYKAERHLGIYALYVMFYPQMVAGPIERPQHILPQLHSRHAFNSNSFVLGIFLICVGLFKKVVIADRLGLYVDPVFNHPQSQSATNLLIGCYFFAFQIYCDFSGYSDIAVGAALTLGIKLMQNFNQPYTSLNIAEFWQRWHISLSTWFRDYVYIPLGGNRVVLWRNCFNLLVVFLISGLWHGANWKYLVWGLAHGCLLIGYQLLRRFNVKINAPVFLKWLISFNLICLIWIFFRANTVNEAFFIIGKIASLNNLRYTAGNVMHLKEMLYCAIIIIALLVGERYLVQPNRFSKGRLIALSLLLVAGCYFLGVFTEAQFIYFQF